MEPHKPWYQRSESQTLDAQRTTISHGLSHEEAGRRREQYGANLIQNAKRKSPLRILLAQFTDLLVLVLIGAALIASFLGESHDVIAIVAIVLLNATLGFTQEYRAERAMEALKALATPQARVKRLGEIVSVPAFDLVPGDIVLLEAGNLVPADLRLLETASLRIDESTLTGESAPIDKMTASIPADRLPVADQRNMAFRGTLVAAGRATGVVVTTGMETQLGNIARLLKEEVEVRTPLQKRLAVFAKRLALVVIALCLIIFVVGLARGEEPVLMFLTSLSLAVAGIPEALPAVVTVALALGARTMIRNKALVRKLPAVEALGSVTFICSDKTGTLTENRMQARGLRVADADRAIMLKAIALNNDVIVGHDGKLQGDPTETALFKTALDEGFDKRQLEREFPRVAELPFSSERGLMTTIHESGAHHIVYSKGAPEKIFPLCSVDLSKQHAAVEEMAREGLRVLAVASRELEHIGELEEVEKNLTFLGLVGLVDPPRDEAKEAVRLCQSAGIQVVMITGDHPSTARTIASQLGILTDSRPGVLTGGELCDIPEPELERRVREISVYARVAPEQKIRIVKALQAVGEIVAMTGDGVNDAPALRRADIGVSMGEGGTDVAREASHIVLLDDNFATIVGAVREGRRIYDNIRKFVRFALSGNSGEIWTLFLAPFLGLPTPLLPIHILWVNLVTDGLPGIALALEPGERELMRRPPRHPRESVFAHGLWQHTLWVGLLTAGATLGTMAWAYQTGRASWQSMAFTVLTLVQMGHVMAIRSEVDSFFSLGFRSNLALTGAVGLTFALQLGALYFPFAQKVFKTQPLTWDELVICVLVSSSVFCAVEIEKWFNCRLRRYKLAP